MEKWKAVWSAWIHWPGWTSWLKWAGWKKIAQWPGWSGWRKWKGWSKVLFPHPIVVLGVTLLSAAGLCWVFLTGREMSVLAFVVYPVAFYALVIFLCFLVKLIPWVKRKTEIDPVYQKIKVLERDGAFGIGMYVEQFINFSYGGFKIISGVVAGSAWIGADGIYNFVQSLVQLYQILRHKKVKTVKEQWKAYRQCGYMMIVLHLTMTGMVFQMTQMGRHEESGEIMIIATAAFTFYKLTNTMIKVIKDRKHKNPIDSAVHFLDFSQALYNLFVLQVGLLWVFGGENFTQAKLMNNLTGGAVCLLVCSMGIYMLWRAKRDMRKLEGTENG